jgi:hypothetical protein
MKLFQIFNKPIGFFNLTAFLAYSFLIIITVFFFIGCKSSDPDGSASENDYLKVTIQGSNFQNNGTFASGGGFDNQSLCDNKIGFYANVFDLTLNSRFSINTDIFHYRNNIDFKSSKVGNHALSQGPSIYSRSCNLTFSVSLQDYSIPYDKTTQLVSGTNNVTKILQVSSSTSSTKYQVTGTFTASFKNSANEIIPVSGSYQTKVTVYN